MLKAEYEQVRHPGTFEDFVARTVDIEGIQVDGLYGRYTAQIFLYNHYTRQTAEPSQDK